MSSCESSLGGLTVPDVSVQLKLYAIIHSESVWSDLLFSSFLSRLSWLISPTHSAASVFGPLASALTSHFLYFCTHFLLPAHLQRPLTWSGGCDSLCPGQQEKTSEALTSAWSPDVLFFTSKLDTFSHRGGLTLGGVTDAGRKSSCRVSLWTAWLMGCDVILSL